MGNIQHSDVVIPFITNIENEINLFVLQHQQKNNSKTTSEHHTSL